MKEQKPAKSDAALRDIRKALEIGSSPHLRFPPKLNAWVRANVGKRERAKFKSFWLAVGRSGDADLQKIARRVRVTKEVFDEWMNTPEVARLVKGFLNRSRGQRARTFLYWAKVLSKEDGIDYVKMLPFAKQAALAFERPASFRLEIEMVLDLHEHGWISISSVKRFFIDLGKCLSHGTRGTRGINPELWNQIDLDIADIILSHNPPMPDKDAVHELQNRGHWIRGHLPTLEVRFRKRKRDLLLAAWRVVAWHKARGTT